MKLEEHGSTFTARAIRLYSLSVLVYTLLIFVLPANKQSMHQYHLSPLEYHILLLATTLPLLVVWFAAVYGYAKLQAYAQSINKASEALAFKRLARGCAWLAWSLPLPAIIALGVNAMANTQPNFQPTVIIVTNYTNLLLSLVGFSLISSASRSLLNQAKIYISAAGIRSIMLFFVVLGVLYCYMTFRHFDPTSLGSAHDPYYLPIWLVVVTVIIPYLYAWFTGLLAAYEITTFSKQVQGVLYRQALQFLVAGLVAVIASFIALQYIVSVALPVEHVVLNYRLALALGFRLIGGVGFVLIILGAARLKKIEEV